MKSGLVCHDGAYTRKACPSDPHPAASVIYKELDPFSSEDKFARSGRAAEEQMAFYLKRFFANDPEIVVLNGIRLEHNGDAAQVDHLLIHSHGLSIVESKSVVGKIQIKDDGQWLRWFGANQSRGMASPITQARLQERFFRDVLGKASKRPDLFSTIPFDLYVAISDSGIILWPKSGQVEGVCKADQVPDRILAANTARVNSGQAQGLALPDRLKIAEFLVKTNKPLRPHEGDVKGEAKVETEVAEATKPQESAVAPAKDSSEIPSNGHACRQCRSTDLEIRYGYSYFFFCKACETNTTIKPICQKCGEPGRLRKQKNTFYVTCERCQGEEVFFVNGG